jgi:hypothetical protein
LLTPLRDMRASLPQRNDSLERQSHGGHTVTMHFDLPPVRLAVSIRALAATVVAAALVAPSASARPPTSGFEEFSGCPEPPVVIDHCLASVLPDVRLQIGNLDVRWDRLTLNGGVPPGFPAPFLHNSRGGLSPTPGPIRDALAQLPRAAGVGRLDGSRLRVVAIPELAGTPLSSLPFGSTFPLRIKLESPLLGDACYIGSERDPLDPQFTSGMTSPPPPNRPIGGALPTFGPDPADPRISVVTGAVLVDNAFTGPAARGCRLFGRRPIDAIVNRLAGLPSPAGTNTFILPLDSRLAPQSLVYPPARSSVVPAVIAASGRG